MIVNNYHCNYIGDMETNHNSNAKTPCQTENTDRVNESNQPPTDPATQNEVQTGDASNEVFGDGKGKTRSPVWNHFKKIIVNGKDKGECNYCHKKFVAGGRSGTKSLLDHYERCMRKPVTDIRQHILLQEQKKADGSQSSYLSNHNFNAITCRKNLAEMIIVHEYPLSMVEHHGFRKFVGGLHPLFKVPSRNTIKSDILKIYDYEKERTYKLLGKNKSRVAITTDMWTTSHQKKGFIAVTDQNWNMQS